MTVQEFMKKSGCSVKHKGYELLETAIQEHIKSPTVNITDILYVIANKEDCPYGTIERNIRYAVLTGFEKMDPAIKDAIFSNEEKITVGKYIHAVSYAIRKGLI